MESVLRVDLETYSSVDIKKAGAYAYVDSPDFEILLFGYAWDDEPVQVVDLLDFEEIPADVVEALTDATIIKKAYNAAFERTCLAKHFNRPMPPEQWRCTAVHASYMGLPGYLEGVAKVLNLPAQKDASGKALIKYFAVPCKPTKVNGGRTRNMPEHAPEKWAEFKAYCAQDVVVEREIDHKLAKHPMPGFEWRLWALDQKINDRGVRLDPKLVNHAIVCDTEHKGRLTEEAIQVTGLDNPNSVAQLKEWFLQAEGLEIESLNKDAIPDLIKQANGDDVKRALELRQEMAKTSVKKYQAMQRAICSDDRVRGLLQFYGANRTGRWAGRLVQVQNLPQNKLEDLDLARELLLAGEYELIEVLFGSTSNVLSQLIRTAFIPAEGRRFIVADFSAIEARVIAWYAFEEWRLEVFRTHGKIYEASASQMFGVPLERIKKGNPEYELRPKGKVAELALGYNGGPNALINMGALDMGLMEEELQPLVDVWREANPGIVKFWKHVGNAAITAVEEKRTVKLQHGLAFIYEPGCLFCRLPSGRRLAYVRPRLEEGKFGKPQLSYEGVNDKKIWGRIRTYGGKLVENIVQATARDCLAEGMMRLDAAGYDLVMHVHDEVIADEAGGSVEHMAEILGQPIDWAPGLPLRADGFETTFYKKD